jgi:hypothetical protein
LTAGPRIVVILVAVEWKPVVGWEGLYEVNAVGDVRSVDRTVIFSRLGRPVRRPIPGQILAQGVRSGGHLGVVLCRAGERQSVLTHRLVLEAFVGSPPEGMVCCHNNGVPSDNRLENLRWDTPISNAQDALRHGANHQASRTHCKYGHEFTGENVYREPGSNERICRACRVRRAREWRAAHPKAAAS